MSDEEAFLARWSRRKRDAAEPAQSPPENAAPSTAAVPPAEAPPEPAKLPPIESIGADSDISAFLAAGVPADLSQAALRRAWAADPAIRDFIGLSENSWDFTALDGVPGFGAIAPDDVTRLLKQVMGEAEEAETVAEAVPTAASEPAACETPAPAAAAGEAEETQGKTDESPPTYKVNAAVQNGSGEGESSAAPAPRRHGGALPD